MSMHDPYYVPAENPFVSNMLTATVAQVVLTLSYSANSILVRGATMDGATPGVQGFFFNVSYVTYFCSRNKVSGLSFSHAILTL